MVQEKLMAECPFCKGKIDLRKVPAYKVMVRRAFFAGRGSGR